MAWKLELDSAAARDLDKLDPQTARRILAFLHDRIATLDDPRSIGEALKGSKLGVFWKLLVFCVSANEVSLGWLTTIHL